MGLWAPLAQLGHGAIRLLVGRLLTLDKAREGAPGLLVVLVYWKPSPSPPWGSRWASSDPCLRFHSLTELLSLFCLNDSCAGPAPRPVPPIAHDSTTTAARNGANDSHNLVSPRRSNSSYSTSPSPCRLAATSMPGREYRSFSAHVGHDTADVNRRTPAARPQARSSWGGRFRQYSCLQI